MTDPHRVVLVDDDENLCTLLALALEHFGFAVTGVTSGEEALRLVIDDPPDLVLLDVDMPGMDGFATCRALRAAGATIPIVFLSARDVEDRDRAARGVGADGYITKPVGLDSLDRSLRAHIDRGRLS